MTAHVEDRGPCLQAPLGFGNVAQKTVLDYLQHQKTLPELKRTKFEVRARAGAESAPHPADQHV
ncbi:hypothetical protein EOB77_09915 [Mesorhizobium sp. M7A.F.Ca.MR.228.00.0.0]|nr:hypothetical protein EOB77_09915 [Mesorhizobium sp. M7A.F.Ca.MR.228.00.0.0]